MRVIKKMYFVLFLLSFAFLTYQCGGNNKDDSAQEEAVQTNNVANETAALKGDPIEGKTLFSQTCAACHGTDAKGLPHLGKDLTTSSFVQEKNNKELIQFVEQGRQLDDPLNTTGVAMPPKGGNPALTEQQLLDIITYIKQLHN